jgi:hypothetical protein
MFLVIMINNTLTSSERLSYRLCDRKPQSHHHNKYHIQLDDYQDNIHYHSHNGQLDLDDNTLLHNSPIHIHFQCSTHIHHLVLDIAYIVNIALVFGSGYTRTYLSPRVIARAIVIRSLAKFSW